MVAPSANAGGGGSLPIEFVAKFTVSYLKELRFMRYRRHVVWQYLRLFVFDRRKQTWCNYGMGTGLGENRIARLIKLGDQVNVGNLALFNLNNGRLDTAVVYQDIYSAPGCILSINDTTYSLIHYTLYIRTSTGTDIYPLTSDPPVSDYYADHNKYPSVNSSFPILIVFSEKSSFPMSY